MRILVHIALVFSFSSYFIKKKGESVEVLFRWFIDPVKARTRAWE